MIAAIKETNNIPPITSVPLKLGRVINQNYQTKLAR